MREVAFDYFLGRWKAFIGGLAGEVLLEPMNGNGKYEIVWAGNRLPLQTDLVYDPVTFTLKNEEFCVSLWGREGVPFNNEIFTISCRLGSGGEEQFQLWGAYRVGDTNSDGDRPRSPEHPFWDLRARVVQRYPRGNATPPPSLPGEIEIRPRGNEFDIFQVGDPEPYDVLIGHDDNRTLISKESRNNLSRTIAQWQRSGAQTSVFAMLSMPREDMVDLRRRHSRIGDHSEAFLELARDFNLLPLELSAFLSAKPLDDGGGVIVWGAEDEG